MADQSQIWVFSEKPSLLAELIGGARGLGQGTVITALVLGSRQSAGEAISRGANRVVWLGEPAADRMVEDYVPTLSGLVVEQKPSLLLFGSTVRGKTVAGRLAARLGTTVLTDVKEFRSADGGYQIQHMLFGGGAVRIERPLGDIVLATVGPGMFDALPLQPGQTGEVVGAPYVEPEWRVVVRERRPRAASTVNLAAARKVVCPGRGVAQQEDLKIIHELAQLIGAELACTRPLAEGLDWLPRERYIGISGAQIKPDLYLGIGVSGQVQHMVGMSDSRVVVAINKDENAPIFAHADYGIVGDLYAVVPELIQALKARR